MTTDASLSLGQYGKTFQERFVQALLVDERFGEQMLEVFKVEYLDLKYLQFLSQRFFDYAKKYRVFPSLPLLVTIIKDELKSGMGSDAALRDQIIEYLRRTQSNSDQGDLPFVKEKSLQFCRKQALRQALLQAADNMEAERYETIAESIKRACMVGTAPSIGHDFFEEPEARFTKLNRDAIPTGIPQLDRKEVLNGGLGKGELCSIVAPTGVGKSHFLVMLGCNALREGKNVVHYTMELSEVATGVRYDSNLCDIDSTNVIDNKDIVLSRYQDATGLGRLIIKYEPMNHATVYTIRAHLERLLLKGFKPHMIIIDYADKMRSTRQYDQPRLELTNVYEELRVLATDLGVPVVTASQSNKEGSNQEIVDLANMSESYGKAATCDVVLSISRRAHEKSLGVGRLFVAKNRAGKDGILYPITIDTARSKFVVRGDEMNLSQATIEDENDTKKILKKRWDELKSSERLNLQGVEQGQPSS